MTPKVIPFRRAASDAADRERIAQCLDQSLIVEASAGPGKTTALVERIAKVLESGRARVQQLVAVTFTHKAAGELKLRLRQRLDQRLRAVPRASRPALETALRSLEEATIGTIHSFCSQILRERPVEARVDPLFVEAGPEEQRRLMDRAFGRWLEERLEAGSIPLKRVLARHSREGEAPTAKLRRAASEFAEWRDYSAAWTRPEWHREAALEALTRLAENTAERLSTSPTFQPLRTFVQERRRAAALGGQDDAYREARLIHLRTELLKSRAKLDELNHALKRFHEDADADLAAGLAQELQLFLTRYEEIKRQAGRLDFRDQLIRARDLVRDSPLVRRYLQERFTHFFIDEFQDTDPVQAELFLLLAADDPAENNWRRVRPAPGKLFLVGDSKQSIYKFRGADVRLYTSVCAQLEAAGEARLTLRQSFRAVRPIQGFVNLAFAGVMTGDLSLGQAAYSPPEEVAPAIEGQPLLVFLDLLDAVNPENGRVAERRVEQILPGAVGQFIDWLLRESGWSVRATRGVGLEPVRPEHICILFRKMAGYDGADLTRDLIVELEQRGLPHVLAGSKAFYEREEIHTLRVALNAIEWPGDTLHVCATLRGPLFSFRDETLFAYSQRARLHPLAERPEPLTKEDSELGEALDLLAALHRSRNRRPVADTINQLLEAVRAPGVLALRPGASQVLANVYRLMDRARSLEAGGLLSFRAFVNWLEDQTETGGPGDSPRAEEAAPGIRLMSVHAAKGLEFPVVILADITTKIRRREPERHVDTDQGLCAFELAGLTPRELSNAAEEEAGREEAEGHRVAYVAATRARDLLVIPGLQGRKGWVRPPGSWLQALEQPMQMPEFRHYWWQASSPAGPESTRAALLALVLEDSGYAAETLSAQQAWPAARPALLERSGQPSREILLPHRLRAAPPAAVHGEVLHLNRDPHRPAGRRFGALVHAALRFAGSGEVADVVELQGRILGATTEEIEAAARAVESVLAHPLWQEPLAADRILRETPLSFALDDGRVVDGMVDLAFLCGGKWTVVDFKSGQEDPAASGQQVSWYAYGLSRITGQSSRAVVMVI